MVKTAIKSLLRFVAPRYSLSLMTRREDRHMQRVMAAAGIPEITSALTKRYGLKVQSGPFSGMQYLGHASGSAFIPKIVGCYEDEIRPVIEQMIQCHYETVIDIGSAEGYYAVGLAMRLPGTPNIYAYDVNPDARKQCSELAIKNNVGERITIRGHCSADELETTLSGKSLVICDCEGYEVELLNPDIAPRLKKAEILVELHDGKRAGVTPTLTNRFLQSHHLTFIDIQERIPSAYPQLQFLTPEQQKMALTEFRNIPQQWAVMMPKAEC